MPLDIFLSIIYIVLLFVFVRSLGNRFIYVRCLNGNGFGNRFSILFGDIIIRLSHNNLLGIRFGILFGVIMGIRFRAVAFWVPSGLHYLKLCITVGKTL